MLTTVFITVLSHNLAIGVAAGIALSAAFFSRKIAKVFVDTVLSQMEYNVHSVAGQIYFSSQ